MKDTITPERLANIINAGFKSTKKDPREVIKEADITRQQLWRIRKGKASTKQLGKILELCKSLSVSLN